jgi:hypothetical protein
MIAGHLLRARNALTPWLNFKTPNSIGVGTCDQNGSVLSGRPKPRVYGRSTALDNLIEMLTATKADETRRQESTTPDLLESLHESSAAGITR